VAWSRLGCPDNRAGLVTQARLIMYLSRKAYSPELQAISERRTGSGSCYGEMGFVDWSCGPPARPWLCRPLRWDPLQNRIHPPAVCAAQSLVSCGGALSILSLARRAALDRKSVPGTNLACSQKGVESRAFEVESADGACLGWARPYISRCSTAAVRVRSDRGSAPSRIGRSGSDRRK
jgi:hypothetical protein